MTLSLASRRRRPVRATAAAAAMVLCAATPALVTSAPAATAATPVAAKSGGASGWWYDALGIANAHKVATGKGSTVAMWDFKWADGARELQGQDVELRTYCDHKRVRPNGGTSAEHGVSMASLVAGNGRGTGPGGSGIAGVAPDAKVLFYGTETRKEGDKLFGTSCTGYDADWQVADALKRGATVFNFSISNFGGGPMEDALLKATTTGRAVVVASSGEYVAGKNTSIGTPAGTAGFIAVNAVDRKGQAWRYNPLTNEAGAPRSAVKGRFVVLSAPGVQTPVLRRVGGRWKSGVPTDGTSQAAAIVSGMVALVQQKWPEATGNQIVQSLIHNTGRDSYGWDKYYGFGIPNLKKMLAQDPAGWPDVNPLLEGPGPALKKFPPSVYEKPAADTGSDTSSDGDDPSGSSESASPSASGQQDGDRADAQPDATQDQGGVPAWVWVGGVLVLAAAGATTIFVTRRGSRA